MLDQDDDDLRIVLGAVFGVIALVIGLVIGLGVYKTHHAKPRAAVGAVESGMCRFANGIQVVQVGFAILAGNHATAGIVRGGNNRNGFLGDVDSQFQAA